MAAADSTGDWSIEWLSRELGPPLFESLLGSRISGLVLMDEDLRVLEANDFAGELLGYPRAKLLGRSLEELAGPGPHPDDHLLRHDFRPEAFAPAWRWTRPDGGELWLRTQPTRLAEERYRFRWALVLRDVTLEHEATLQRRAAEERVRLALSAARMGDWSWDSKTGVVAWSPGVERIFGIETGTFKGTFDAFIDLIHPDHRARSRQNIARAFSSMEEFTLEHRLANAPADESRWVRCQGRVITDEQGRPERMVGVAFDVTDLKRLEYALRTSSERFESLARATRDLVYDWDIARGTTEWNENITVAFGHPRELSTASAFWESLIHPEDRARVLGERARAMDQGAASWTCEYRFQRSDGRYAQVLDRGFFIGEAGGRPQRLLGVMVDVTELREAQNRLAISDRMASLGTLAAGVAHEINNPLSWILYNLSALREGLARLQEPGRDLSREAKSELRGLSSILEETLDGAERVRGITRDLRTFSRPDDEVMQPIALSAVLDSTLSLAGNVLRHRARVIREYRDATPVFGSSSRLGQAFLNLVMNAAQAMPEGGVERNVLRVTVERVGNRVSVSIADTGAGIPDDARPHIFDPFFSTKPAALGTGLGLSICKRIIDAHGGEIQLESQSDRGTLFRVLLPIAREQATREEDLAPALASPPRGRLRSVDAERRRLLVLDDEPMVGRALARSLSEHEVTVITSPREALQRMAAGERWDIVLCDLMMPEMAAPELRERLARLDPLLLARTIYMTGGALTQAAAEFLRNVPNPRLEKPFEVAEVRTTMAEVFNRRV